MIYHHHRRRQPHHGKPKPMPKPPHQGKPQPQGPHIKKPPFGYQIIYRISLKCECCFLIQIMIILGILIQKWKISAIKQPPAKSYLIAIYRKGNTIARHVTTDEKKAP